MSVRSFLHRYLKLGGHDWLPTVQESIVDPLDGDREISYRAIRKCRLCKCVEKDWRVVAGAASELRRSTSRTRSAPQDWRFSLIGLILKPLAIIALLALLLINAASLSIQGMRGLFGVA